MEWNLKCIYIEGTVEVMEMYEWRIHQKFFWYSPKNSLGPPKRLFMGNSISNRVSRSTHTAWRNSIDWHYCSWIAEHGFVVFHTRQQKLDSAISFFYVVDPTEPTVWRNLEVLSNVVNTLIYLVAWSSTLTTSSNSVSLVESLVHRYGIPISN